MVPKVERIEAYLEELLAIKSYKTLVTWPCEITLKTKTIESQLPQCLWPPKLANWWHTFRYFHLKSYVALKSRGLARSRDKLKQHISTTAMSIATKLDRMVTYHEGLPPVKLHNPLIKWSCKIL